MNDNKYLVLWYGRNSLTMICLYRIILNMKNDMEKSMLDPFFV